MVFGLIGGEFHFSNARFSQLHSITYSHCMYLQVPDNQALAIIAPLWPQHPWFSEVLQLLISALIHLLCFPKLLTQAKGKFHHQNFPFLALRTWVLSSNQLEIKSFRKMLQTFSQNQEEHLLRKSMMQNGSYTAIGVIERRLTQSQPLLQL